MYTIKRSYKSEDTYQRVGFWGARRTTGVWGLATGARQPGLGWPGGDDRPLVARRRLQIGGHGATWAGANWGRGATGASGVGTLWQADSGVSRGQGRGKTRLFWKRSAHVAFRESTGTCNVYRGGPKTRVPNNPTKKTKRLSRRPKLLRIKDSFCSVKCRVI
jgi:hypothetical protein